MASNCHTDVHDPKSYYPGTDRKFSRYTYSHLLPDSEQFTPQQNNDPNGSTGHCLQSNTINPSRSEGDRRTYASIHSLSSAGHFSEAKDLPTLLALGSGPSHTGPPSSDLASTTQFRLSVQATDQFKSRVQTDQGRSASSRNHGLYYCEHEDCMDSLGKPLKFFSHKAHKVRHIKTSHEKHYTDCPFRHCNRKGTYGFTRRDQLIQHQRAYHALDIPKRIYGLRRDQDCKTPNSVPRQTHIHTHTTSKAYVG